MREAFSSYKQHFGETMDFLMVEVMLRVICFMPLLFLLRKDTAFLALLTPVLWLALVPHLRQNAAACYQEGIEGRGLLSPQLISAKGYGRHLLQGIGRGLLLCLWASPFIAATLWGYRIAFGDTVVGQTDVVSVMMQLSLIGNGDFIVGGAKVFGIYLLTLLPFLFGLAFHSGRRHEAALQERKLIRGHRFGVIRTHILSLVVLLPFLLVAGWSLGSYIMKLVTSLTTVSAGGLTIPSPRRALLICGAAALVLLLPVIPLKSLFTAHYVHDLREDRD
ncbi:MAG: hypothetical protein IJ083_07085 [Clostridia bacterium]|nr:hypothetical protein [Clostridia bacterium]